MADILVLTAADLAVFRLPDRPFRVPAASVRVTDGDTIRIMSGRKSPFTAEEPAIRLRFRSIAAPETRKSRWADRPLVALGADPDQNDPGRHATEVLRGFVRGRDLIISHQGRFDAYGRLLADISVLPNRRSRPEEAISLERVMLARGVVTRFGTERVPDLHPFGDNLTPSP